MYLLKLKKNFLFYKYLQMLTILMLFVASFFSFSYGQGTVEKTVTLSDRTVDNETRELSPAIFSATDFPNSCEIIANVEVSITWRKTAGTCNNPTTGNAYHRETGFKLKGPDGTEVILAPTNTWTGNSATGYITTVFSDDAGAFPAHAVPVSGTFKPHNSLFSHFGEKNASGSWVLVAEDDAGGDPLCVESYTIKIITTCTVSDIETGTWTGSPAESVDNNETEVGAITFTRSDFTSNCDPLEIKNVKVSINWTKTGGTCTNPNTGSAYHNETSFKLKSPTGTVVTLASTGTWSGGEDIDYVTTVFVDSETTAPSGTPISGRFKPEGTLNSFTGESPLGTWTLIAGDSAGGDELCVKTYSVSILTDACEDTYTTCNENEKILNGSFDGNSIDNWTVTTPTNKPLIVATSGCLTLAYDSYWVVCNGELDVIQADTDSKSIIESNAMNFCGGATKVKFSINRRNHGAFSLIVRLGGKIITSIIDTSYYYGTSTITNANNEVSNIETKLDGSIASVSQDFGDLYWHDVELTIPPFTPTNQKLTFEYEVDASIGRPRVIFDDISVKDILPTWPNEPISRTEERMCEGTSFDLTSLILPAAPTGYEYFWHTDSTPTTANKVADPTSVIAGTYFLFLGNDCCYSPLLDQIKIVEKICIDTDNDGITDDIDLDDDNDGILDVDECNNPNLITNGGFEAGNQSFDTFYDYVTCTGGSTMGAGRISIQQDASACWSGWGRTARSGNNFLLIDFPSSGTSTFWEQTVAVQPNTQYFFSGYISNLITANTSSPNPSFRWIVTDVTNSSTIMDGTGFDVLPSEGWKRAEVTFTTSASTTQIKIQIQNGTAGSSGLDAGLDDLFLQAVCDADGDNTPNHLDPDSDDDGCSDADEAYQNNDTDVDNNGYYGSGIPTFNPPSGGVSNQGVDAEGKVIGASYGTPNQKYLQGLAISLASSPANQITCVNDNAVFTASANGVVSANTPPSTTLNYKWQYSTNGSTWNDITTIAGINTISGAAGTVASGAMATLNLEGIAANVDGYLFRAVFTSAESVCAEVITNFAPLTVNSTDSDGDGIADGCDLDDDNDGILDTDELNCTNTVLNSTNILTNGSFEDGTQGFSTSYTYIPASSYTPTTPFINQSYAITSNAKLCDERWGDTNYLSPIEGNQFIALNFAGAAANTVFWQKTIPVTPSTKYLFSGNIANLFKDVYAGASGTSPDPRFSWTIVDDKGNTLIDLNGFPVGRNSGWMSASTEFTTQANSESVTIYLKNNLAGIGDYDAVAIDDMKIQAYYCDTDGDGVPNQLDLDSDNDNCPDALEANATLNYSNLDANYRKTTAVDTNPISTTYGVPGTVAVGVGTSQDATVQADECDECNSTSSLFVDSDGDTIGDACDLDDDNDGILDTEECNPISTQVMTGSGAYQDKLMFFDWAGVNLKGTNPTTSFNYKGMEYKAEIISIDKTGDNIAGFENSEIAGNNTGYFYTTGKYILNDNAMRPALFSRFKTELTGGKVTFVIKFSASKDGVTYPIEIATFDAENTVTNQEKLTVNTSGSNFEMLEELGGDMSAITGVGTQSVSYINSRPAHSNSGSAIFVSKSTHSNNSLVLTTVMDKLASVGTEHTVKVAFAVKLNCNVVYGDLDGDGLINPLDLDSDNDGCPDAMEGAGTFTKTLVAAQGGLTGGTGSTVTENLGNNVPTFGSNIGIPTVAGAGQSKGGSQQAAQITITQQPSNEIVCIGSQATLTVKAKATLADGYNVTTHEPTYSGAASVEQVNYQWQKWDGTAWQNATESGNNGTANSNAEISYTTATNTIANDGDQYRVVLTSTGMVCEKESTSATLTVPAYTNNNTSNGFKGGYLCSSNGTTPQLTFNFVNSTFTAGKTYTITYEVTAGSTINTYTQTLTTDPQSFTPGAYPTSASQGVYEYRLLSITNDSGCTTPASEIKKKKAQIRIYETPSCSISGETTVCPRATVSYTAPSGMSSYVWTVSGGATISSGGNTQTVSVLADSGNNTSFTLSLEITKEYAGFLICSSTCSKTITVEDTTPPEITLTSPQSVCVADITNASYNLTTNGDVNTPPDYYQFPTGDTTLDITAITDACCGNDISNYSITWSMSPQSNGATVSGTGQPSATIGTKKLWLDIDAVNPKSSYTAKTYTVTYTVTDCNNNVRTGTTTITVKPRPKITIVN